jgi:hypothetical protein
MAHQLKKFEKLEKSCTGEQLLLTRTQIKIIVVFFDRPHDFQRSRFQAQSLFLASYFVRAFIFLVVERFPLKFLQFLVVFAVVELNPGMRKWNIQLKSDGNRTNVLSRSEAEMQSARVLPSPSGFMTARNSNSSFASLLTKSTVQPLSSGYLRETKLQCKQIIDWKACGFIHELAFAFCHPTLGRRNRC